MAFGDRGEKARNFFRDPIGATNSRPSGSGSATEVKTVGQPASTSVASGASKPVTDPNAWNGAYSPASQRRSLVSAGAQVSAATGREEKRRSLLGGG